MFQKQLGKDSFWAPYIDLMPDVTFFCDLPSNEIRETHDPFLIAEVKEYKEELDVQFDQVSEILSKYPSIFEPRTLERQNFLSIYA